MGPTLGLLTMKYSSTRGGVSDVTFEEALFTGYAADGGILLPVSIPTVNKATLEKWRELSFQDLATEIVSLFISETEIPKEDLQCKFLSFLTTPTFIENRRNIKWSYTDIHWNMSIEEILNEATTVLIQYLNKIKFYMY